VLAARMLKVDGKLLGWEALSLSLQAPGPSVSAIAYSSHEGVCTNHPVCSSRADSTHAGDLRVGNGSIVASRRHIARTSKLPCSCRSRTERFEQFSQCPARVQ
jgi:hypothetical protein